MKTWGSVVGLLKSYKRGSNVRQKYTNVYAVLTVGRKPTRTGIVRLRVFDFVLGVARKFSIIGSYRVRPRATRW